MTTFRARQSFWSRPRTLSVSTGGSEEVAYAKQIDAQVDALDADIKRDLCDGSKFCGGVVGARKSTIEFLNTWTKWVQDWRAYYNAHVNVNFPAAPGMVSRADLDLYRAQYDDFEKKFRTTGAVVTVPKLPVPEHGISIPWKPILWIGAIVAGVYAVREVRSFFPKKAEGP